MFAFALALAAAGCSSGEPAAREALGRTASPLSIPEKQGLMNSLFDMNNVVTININMDPAQWSALLNEEPVGGRCNFENPPSVDRFQSRPTTQVTVSGTHYPLTAVTFSGVQIKKKSFCGSFSNSKPAFKLKFTSVAEDYLGTANLTFNNTIQDPSYVRQCLGYTLYGMAGLPHSRCNFAKVIVNGSLVADGIYVNVEPIRERYLDNPDNHFAHPNTGNLYEFEYGDDFDPNRVQYIDTESSSVFTNKNDLSIAANAVASGFDDRINQVMDATETVKIFAMEYLLKHWDGYNFNRNNTYVYNDVVAVSNPSSSPLDPNQIHFKLIPWGIDQILQSSDDNSIALFRVSTSRNKLVYPLGFRTPGNLYSQIGALRESVFSRAQISGPLKNLIDLMQNQLASLGFGNTAEIAKVRQQLDLVRSGGFALGGLSPTGYTTAATGGVYVLDKASGEAMHASNSENIPGGSSTAFEVVHQTRQDSAADRWMFVFPSHGGGSFEIFNEAYNRYLHASNTFITPQNHYMFYTTPDPDTIRSQNYYLFAEQLNSGDLIGYTGYWTLLNARTGRYLRFGTNDPTPSSGRQRVYQDSTGSLFSLY